MGQFWVLLYTPLYTTILILYPFEYLVIVYIPPEYHPFFGSNLGHFWVKNGSKMTHFSPKIDPKLTHFWVRFWRVIRATALITLPNNTVIPENAGDRRTTLPAHRPTWVVTTTNSETCCRIMLARGHATACHILRSTESDALDYYYLTQVR